MGRHVTISAKARRELLGEAKWLNIHVSKLIRRTLEEEMRRRRLMELEKRLKSKGNILANIKGAGICF